MAVRGVSNITRRHTGERGAVLIEAMLVLPVLLLFIFGTLEYGFALSDWLATGNATRDGAREASVSGKFLQADYNILQAIDKAASAIPDSDIERIVVFKATAGPGSDTPCKTGASQPGTCNVYTSEHLSWDQSEFGCDKSDTPWDPDSYWCPTTRNAKVETADYIGVYIRVRHDFATGFFGDGVDLEDTTIFRIEPTER